MIVLVASQLLTVAGGLVDGVAEVLSVVLFVDLPLRSSRSRVQASLDQHPS